MSEIYRRYIFGGEVKGSELNTKDGLELFGGRMWSDHVRDQNTAQLTLDGDIVWKKTKPQQPRLLRPTEVQESQERCVVFEKCKEWQIPLITRRVKVVETSRKLVDGRRK